MALGGKRPGAGRKKGDGALRALEARRRICDELDKNLLPIIKKAIEQAKDGNKDARDWLSDQAWGKIPQAVDVTSQGDKLESVGAIVITDLAKKLNEIHRSSGIRSDGTDASTLDGEAHNKDK